MSSLRIAALIAVLVLVPLSVGSVVYDNPAAACHGNGVSRSCFGGPVRLEAVSYGPDMGQIYVAADYYYNWNFLIYGDNLCQFEPASCVHGIWRTEGTASQYQVFGSHAFEHVTGGGWYWLADSSAIGECFPAESDGCG